MSEEKNSAVNLKKEMIIRKMKESGCRITRNRELLLDILLEEECSSSKEIYYKASSRNRKIGTATVYRMLNLLEKIGVIDRENMYRISDFPVEKTCEGVRIELDDGTIIDMTSENGKRVMQLGLKAAGYIDQQNVRNITKQEEDGKKYELQNDKIYQ